MIMKTYRIYVQNPKDGDYYYQGTKEGKLSDILQSCKEKYEGKKGYIRNYSETKILRKF